MGERMKLFHAIETIPAVAVKAQWAVDWINPDRSFYERLVGFACVEGILFSGSFCAIYWLKKNELISRDEGLHTDFACLIYKLMKHQLDDEMVHEIIRGAVAAEKEFICDA